MGSANDLGNLLGSNASNQEADNQSLTHEGGEIPKIIIPVENFKIKNKNMIIETKDTSGFSVWGRDSWNAIAGYTWSAGSTNWVEIVRRLWEYNTTALLDTGTSSANVTTANDIITIK